ALGIPCHTITCRTIEKGRTVRLPVAIATGSVADWVLK
ncbi:hypothetical protein MGSAQ_001012, partial [marine sediment metagenome]